MKAPRWWLALLAFWLMWSAGDQAAYAAPLALTGGWRRAAADARAPEQPLLPAAEFTPVAELDRTGGRYVFLGSFVVKRGARYVIDFSSSSAIGRFRHRVFDASGKLQRELRGGIQSAEINPFFLRHGRELELTPGSYTLVTELDSPFLLGQPQPFVEDLDAYRQAIKPGNALTLLGLGIFLGLGLYYAALAFWRRRVADAMYALFILGNLLYNGTVLLFLPDLFGVRWFYLISFPILFSNAAYVLFVLALLEVRRRTHPKLHAAAMGLLGLFAAFVVVSLFKPNWSLECDRYGVALFVSYGLAVALVRAQEGSSSARMYLGSLVVFAGLALAAISLTRLDAHAIYIEHIGLLAVAVEVSLLALVLAHQFAQLHSERDKAERRAKESIRIAHSDALTGLPNRYQLEAELLKLPSEGSLTFIDLDGLKHYNDRFGHQRGDELLCSFANHIQRRLTQGARVHRLSGDEFAITSPTGDITAVSLSLQQALKDVRADGFEFSGASYGSVHVHENPSRDRLKHMADTRMYAHKRERGEGRHERARRQA